MGEDADAEPVRGVPHDAGGRRFAGGESAPVNHTQLGDPTVPEDVSRSARELGPLESPLIWITFTVVAVLFVFLAIRFRRRGFRRATVAAAVVCALLAGVTGLNSYVGYVRTGADLARLLQRGHGPVGALGLLFDDGARPEAGSPPRADHKGITTVSAGPGAVTAERLSVSDPDRHVPSGTSYVLLPPGYQDPANAGHRYPVVYLVHGYPYGGPEDWLTAGDAVTTLQLMSDDHALRPMIVVSVDLTAGQPSADWEGLDVPGGPQLETYLARTVVPRVDAQYRTVPDRDHRALGGMSGGAFAALNDGLRHVDEFSTLLLALPYDALGDDAGLLKRNPALLSANTPAGYLPSMAFPAPVAVILAAGSGAPTDVTTAKRIAGSFQARGQQAVVHVEPGFNHTWHTARATLPYLLAFADQAFERHPATPVS